MTVPHRTIMNYCKPYPDRPLLENTRQRLASAIVQAERECVLHEIVNAWDLRILATSFDDPVDPLQSMAIIDQAEPTRYAVKEANAPKRASLIRRLWSMFR